MVKAKRRFGKCSGNYKLEDIWADAEEIGGTIRKMEKTYPQLRKKIFVITEGPYDYEFYSRFFPNDKCEIRIANSKNNVIDIVKDINEKTPGTTSDSVIGIIDRDFSFFENQKGLSEDSLIRSSKEEGGEKNGIKNLFMTDTHDIETMIISNELIGKVLEFYKKSTAGGDFQRSMLSALRQKDTLTQLIECSRLIGLSLYVNQKYGLNMTFKHINCKKKNVFLEFTDTSAMKFSEEKFFELIRKRNQTKYDSFKEALLKELLNKENYYENPMQLCRGHDLMCALLADINANYPQKSGEKVLSRDLERIFRNFYDENEFFKTELFREIKAWTESQNSKIAGQIFAKEAA